MRFNYNKINISSYGSGYTYTGYISNKRRYVISVHNYKPVIMGYYVRYGVMPESNYVS